MKRFLLIALIIFLNILISGLTSYFVSRQQANISFIPLTDENNKDYGYLKVTGKRYYQLRTTTQIVDEKTPIGSHYHKIDLIGGK
jgi:hypothetical protein